VTNLQNHDGHFVLDRVDNPIVTNSVAIEVVFSLELYRLAVSWCNGELLNAPPDPRVLPWPEIQSKSLKNPGLAS
jgi:hypothetical protein